MREIVPFDELIRRARDGDESALELLVLDYTPLVRAFARQYMASNRSAAFDSEDVSQSVFRTFCRRLCGGQYDLSSPARLCALLRTIAHNKAIDKKRQEDRAPIFESLNALVLRSREPSPERRLAARESLKLVWARLNGDERRLVKLKIQGVAWGKIAQQLGGTPHGRRMQFQRALTRVEHWLGRSNILAE